MIVGIVHELQEGYVLDQSAPPDDDAEFASLEEIEALNLALRSLGHQVRLIGDLQNFIDFYASGEAVDLVFNYASGKRGQVREAQLPTLLEALRIPYTGADPLSLALCLDKALTKRLWRESGLPTPEFWIVSHADQLGREVEGGLDYPVFVKPIREGSSKGISSESVVKHAADLNRVVAKTLSIYQQPVLIEPYLSGKEYTVGVLGSGETATVLGVVEVACGVRGYLDGAEKKCLDEERHIPVEEGIFRDEICELARRAYLSVGCQVVGRVDIRLDREGRPNLLELNPNPALHPTRSSLPAIGRLAGYSFTDLIFELLSMAAQRWNLAV